MNKASVFFVYYLNKNYCQIFKYLCEIECKNHLRFQKIFLAVHLCYIFYKVVDKDHHRNQHKDDRNLEVQDRVPCKDSQSTYLHILLYTEHVHIALDRVLYTLYTAHHTFKNNFIIQMAQSTFHKHFITLLLLCVPSRPGGQFFTLYYYDNLTIIPYNGDCE